ncbi:hypothetical protein Glove_165g9 [Diversispora epigaea]|uniref:Uncharacterized protein n=1 Tax=Diversispora epigaea TaxID=1348612 RepID=A0A397ITP9_9GLOM|nr:hypothetical protein Glove_165g9 [Diversispora epigaea]
MDYNVSVNLLKAESISPEDKVVDEFVDSMSIAQEENNAIFDFTIISPKNHLIEIMRKEKCQEISDVLQTIACLYKKHVHNAENETLKVNQAEILCLYNYFKEFYYQQIPSTKRENLYKKIYRARKIHELFEKIGVDKIKYSANSISELSDNDLPEIEINEEAEKLYRKQSEESEKTLLETEISELPENVSPETEISVMHSDDAGYDIELKKSNVNNSIIDSKKIPSITTEEFKEIFEGQEISRGPHIKIDFETGKMQNLNPYIVRCKKICTSKRC